MESLVSFVDVAFVEWFNSLPSVVVWFSLHENNEIKKRTDIVDFIKVVIEIVLYRRLVKEFNVVC